MQTNLALLMRVMMTLLLATRNAHKIGEIRAILGSTANCLSLEDYPQAPVVAEDAPSFEGNATKKAVAIAKWVALSPNRPLGKTEAAPLNLLADDSGLEVDALSGMPGVHSARFAALDLNQAANSSDAANNAKLLHLLRDVPLEKRTARFRCVLALTPVSPGSVQISSPVCYAEEPELRTELFEASCEGRIGFDPKGHNGFGYDPLFLPDGYEQTFAELGETIKNQLSHRARALAKLKAWLQRQP